MNDEAKEIIEYLKDEHIYVEDFGYSYKRLSLDENKVLLDYITNLQEEIKEWEYIQDIQDQREYHKKYLEERRKEQPNLLYPDYDEIYKRFFELRDRINKAVGYIENNWIDYETAKPISKYAQLDVAIQEIRELLDILRGE